MPRAAKPKTYQLELFFEELHTLHAAIVKYDKWINDVYERGTNDPAIGEEWVYSKWLKERIEKLKMELK